jgi:hypothetical protein
VPVSCPSEWAVLSFLNLQPSDEEMSTTSTKIHNRKTAKRSIVVRPLLLITVLCLTLARPRHQKARAQLRTRRRSVKRWPGARVACGRQVDPVPDSPDANTQQQPSSSSVDDMPLSHIAKTSAPISKSKKVVSSDSTRFSSLCFIQTASKSKPQSVVDKVG